ncbi:MAG: serine/threonine-protein kinase [Phycisphaerales bacterium]
MTPELWLEARRVCERIWEEAPTAGVGVVEALCSEDRALRELVLELVRADGLASSFLETPPSLPDGLEPAAPPEVTVGATIGAYTILDGLGAGGMGAVYLARQESPSREVALKLLPSPAAADARLFLREAEALGRLSHPGIAQIYEAGVWEVAGGVTPRPFIAMEHVDGVPLDAWVRRNAPSIEARIRMCIRVADAIAHAHQRGVIHRDIKPSNVLVATADGVAIPKVIDFGIARIDEAGSDTTISRDGERRLVGTIPYMSPEQVRGNADAIDTRTDVYAIGAVLYELLTMRRPFGEDGRVFETMRAICEIDPTPMRLHDASIPIDLDAITRKAMAKDPEQRYGSAGELAADLRRILANEPVLARPATRAYRMRRFVARNRLAVACLVAIVVALTTGLTVAGWQANEAKRAARLAESRLADVRALANSVIYELHDAIADLPGAAAARALLLKRAFAYLDDLEAQADADPDLLAELAGAYLRLSRASGADERGNNGDITGANLAAEQALALADRAHAMRPDDEAAALLLAETLELASNRIYPRDAIQGDARIRRALSLRRAFAERRPLDPATTRALVECLKSFGAKCHYDGRIDEMVDTFDEALRVAERQFEATPGHEDAIWARAEALYWGAEFRRLHSMGTDIDAFNRAAAHYELLASNHPDNATYFRADLAATRWIARLTAAEGRREQCIETSLRVLNQFRMASEAEPQNQTAFRDWEASLWMLGELYESLAADQSRPLASRIDDLREALRYHEAALDHMRIRAGRNWLQGREGDYPTDQQEVVDTVRARLTALEQASVLSASAKNPPTSPSPR